MRNDIVLVNTNHGMCLKVKEPSDLSRLARQSKTFWTIGGRRGEDWENKKAAPFGAAF